MTVERGSVTSASGRTRTKFHLLYWVEIVKTRILESVFHYLVTTQHTTSVCSTIRIVRVLNIVYVQGADGFYGTGWLVLVGIILFSNLKTELYRWCQYTTFGKTEFLAHSSLVCNLYFHDETYWLDHDCNKWMYCNWFSVRFYIFRSIYSEIFPIM